MNSNRTLELVVAVLALAVLLWVGYLVLGWLGVIACAAFSALLAWRRWRSQHPS
jgi:hypothetical protein